MNTTAANQSNQPATRPDTINEEMNSDGANKERREKIRVIWNAPQRDRLPDSTNGEIDRLMLNREDDPDYRAVMEEAFGSSLAVDNKPGRQAKASLVKAKKRLGMKDTTAVKMPLRKKTFLRIASAAAVVLVALGITLIRDTKDHPQVAHVTVRAIDGVQKDVRLADDSHVWVNQNSKVSYPEQFANERHVNLEGQAYFDVAKDAKSPFVVHTKHLDVKVLGTEFDVTAYPDAETTVVMLFDGLVEVTAGEQTGLLSPGEKLTYHHRTGGIEVTEIDIAEQGDWRRNAILGHEKTIPELLAMIANYYDEHIVFDPGAFDDNERYTVGFAKHEQVEKVLGVLAELSGSFLFERQSNSIHILK